MSLVYSRSQIQDIFNDFIDAFSTPELKAKLAKVAPDEEKMAGVIERIQGAIFQKHGIDPGRGFQDMTKIMSTYSRDQEISQLVMRCANREEQAFEEAIGNSSTPNQSGALPPGFNAVSHFQQMWSDPAFQRNQAVLAQRLESDPKFREQFEEQMQQLMDKHPELANQQTAFKSWWDEQPEDHRNSMIGQMQSAADKLTLHEQGTVQGPNGATMQGPGAEDMENEME